MSVKRVGTSSYTLEFTALKDGVIGRQWVDCGGLRGTAGAGAGAAGGTEGSLAYRRLGGSRMTVLAAILGIVVLLIILWDGFEVIILPRRVSRKLRLSRLFYRSTWIICSRIARRIRSPKRRERYLSVYGPLSLLFLIMVWATGMILAFALVQWSVGPPRMSFARKHLLERHYVHHPGNGGAAHARRHARC